LKDRIELRLNNLYYTQTLAFLLRKNKKGTPNLLIEQAIIEFWVFEVTFVPFIPFWFLVTFGDEVTKVRKFYVIFVYILQGKMGKTEKSETKIMQLK
jgi:hypothetical protein